MAQLKSGSQMGGAAIATTGQIPAGGIPTGQTTQMGVGGIVYGNWAGGNPGQNVNLGTNQTVAAAQVGNVSAGTWRNIGNPIAVRYLFRNDSSSYFNTSPTLWVRTA